MDLARVFTQRSTFNYVLVIEWLEPGDLRTGQMLLDHLDRSEIPCVDSGCHDAGGFRAILSQALSRIPEWGIPAIHIETHGERPSDDPEEGVLFGSGEGPLLTWSELGEMLAPLNEAADFQLLLVGAACYGSAAQGAMNACDHVAPYAVCIGYETEVLDESVYNSMAEFYSAIIGRQEGAHQAMASAQSRLRPGEKIHFLNSVIVGYQVFRWCVSDLKATHPDMSPALWEEYKRRFFASWDVWFPPDLQQRDGTYKLDWEIVMAPQPPDEQLADAFAEAGTPSDAQGERLRAALLGDSASALVKG